MQEAKKTLVRVIALIWILAAAVAALAALFLAFYMPQWFSPVSVFAGLFATKAAALLYPIVFRTKCLSENK